MHNRIGVWRAETGLSRKDLAEAAGVHVQTIGFIERGDHNPSLEVAMLIAERLGVPLEAVFSIKPFSSLATIVSRSNEKALSK